MKTDKHGHYLKVFVERHVKLFFGLFNRSRSMPLPFPPTICLLSSSVPKHTAPETFKESMLLKFKN